MAIKTIPKENQLDFELEVEFLKVADHPNVVRHYETFEDEGPAQRPPRLKQKAVGVGIPLKQDTR